MPEQINPKRYPKRFVPEVNGNKGWKSDCCQSPYDYVVTKSYLWIIYLLNNQGVKFTFFETSNPYQLQYPISQPDPTHAGNQDVLSWSNFPPTRKRIHDWCLMDRDLCRGICDECDVCEPNSEHWTEIWRKVTKLISLFNLEFITCPDNVWQNMRKIFKDRLALKLLCEKKRWAPMPVPIPPSA